MARTFNKISVPQERGRFAQPALLSQTAPFTPLTASSTGQLTR